MSTNRLWDKGESLDQIIHNFTVGSDPEIDKKIIYWDILASMAHAKMLESVGLLKSQERSDLETHLKALIGIVDSGKFTIPRDLEDCHTAIENYLVENTGDSGKKIHTGRSRNDQVLVAVRLFLKDYLLSLLQKLGRISDNCFERANNTIDLQMPGHTHFQQAMPASIGMWFSAVGEGALELLEEGLALLNNLDINPLGVASGFGSPLKLDRDLTTKLLKFRRTQRNPINTQNSRGKFELAVAKFSSNIASWIEKYSFDLIIYSMDEMRWAILPKGFTTGSSIMPQKRNPDVLELLRGSASKIRACDMEIQGIISKLPSHYHRDFQLTKEPLMRSCETTSTCLEIFSKVMETTEFNLEKIESAKSKELYATYYAFRLVKEGEPFRDAYKKTSEVLASGKIDIKDLQADFLEVSNTLKSELEASRIELKALREQSDEKFKKFNSLENSLFP